jgi:hypothetical protein
MARVPPPNKSAKGAPPPATKVVGNLDKPESTAAPAPLNFKVPQAFRREFKIYAAQRGKKLNELLYEAFQALKEKNGS